MHLINRIYSNINNSSFLNIRRKLIVSTSFLVLFLIVVNLLIFYISAKENYIKEIEMSNENLIKQIGFSYETVLQNVKNSIFKTTLLDKDLINLIQEYNNSFDHRNDIFDKLYNITLLNEYIHSAYLYVPKYNQVFSTSNNTEKISSYEAFTDQAVFSMIKEKGHYTLGPRMIEYYKTQKQIMSVVSSVPLYSQQALAFLAVNVDLDKLRYNILLKCKQNQNMYFYVIDSNNSVIITNNISTDLGTTFAEKLNNRISYTNTLNKFLNKKTVFISIYDSKSLNWKFILENFVEPLTGNSTAYMKNLLWFITVSIYLLIITLVVLIITITIFTKPVNKLMLKYKEKIWKDFITDNTQPTEDLKEQLIDDQFDNNAGKYGVIVLQVEHNKFTEEIINYFKSELNNMIVIYKEKNNFKAKVINTSKDSFTIIVSYMNDASVNYCEEQLIRLAQMIYDNIKLIYRNSVYVGISTIKEQLNEIPSLYRECTEALKYKLTHDSQLLSYSTIKDKQKYYEYPHGMEKQLLNNISTGNIETCKQILDEFFLLFRKADTRVEDSVIKSSIYKLEDAILNYIRGLPIYNDDTPKIDMLKSKNIDEIKASFTEFIENICMKITEKRNEEKSKIYKKVLDYIEKNYTQPDISLNKIADIINMNRNYVSKIISEATGKNFNDYINDKRIALAKELLQDENKTIKDIAEEVGYNYSYYFIKIFKSIEGVTPGQYRNSIK